MSQALTSIWRLFVQAFVRAADLVMSRMESHGWSGRFRLLISIFLYAAGTVFSFWLAYQLRHDFRADSQVPGYWKNLIWILPLKLWIFLLFRMFDGMLAYFSLPDLLRMAYALLLSSLIIYGVRLIFAADLQLNLGIIPLDLLISLVLFSAVRVLLRMSRESVMDHRQKEGGPRRRVAVIGAGEEGALLVRELSNRPSLGLVPVFFMDDNPNRHHSRIHEIPVLGPTDVLREDDIRGRVDEVLFSDSKLGADRVREIVSLLRQLKLPYRTITPFLKDTAGTTNQPILKPLELADFLGREPANLDNVGLQKLIERKVVLITGAGGSIGSELVRQVAQRRPRLLVLVERSEGSLFQIQQEIQFRFPSLQLRCEVADICHDDRMANLFREVRPSVVYHAAAHKHVPMMEQQPGEALFNNSMGTYRLASQAAAYEVERFILISTDKAVHPSSVMGATKRLAELALLFLQREHPGTRFMMVRFGNVLGSSGSVIPLFEQQIRRGGPVTVTHPDVTRYFMTIPEAVGLVLECSLLGQSSDLFALDMGEPVRIVDLARQLIEFYGHRPNEDMPILYTGLRPGEKLHEELFYSGEEMQTTEHPKVFRIRHEQIPTHEWWDQLEALIQSRYQLSPDELVERMRNLLPEYKPAYNS